MFKKKVAGIELEHVSNYLIGALPAPIIKRQFVSYLKELEELVSKKGTILNFEKMANWCLTTLRITLNYFVQPHVNHEDVGFVFLNLFTRSNI